MAENVNQQPMSSYPMVIWSDGHGFNVEWRGREDAQCHQESFYKCGERTPFRFQNEIDQMNWFYEW
jgi:hypothetical protein